MVSIIIPTYKRPDRLDRAIESCLNQTYKNIEIIVVDDNNEGDEYREETRNLMKKYSNNTRIHYITHKINRNGSAARNTGIRNAKGNYISFLDDDDEMLPTKVERQVDMMNHCDSSYGVVCCGVIIKEESTGKIIRISRPSTSERSQYEFLRIRFGMGTGSNPLFRREAIEQTGLFDESFVRRQDTEYMIRLLRNFKVKVLPEELVIKYVFGYPNRPNMKKFLEVQNHLFDVFKEDIEKYSKDEQAEIYRNNWAQMCSVAIESGDYKCAQMCYKTGKSYKDYSLRTKMGFIKQRIRKLI